MSFSDYQLLCASSMAYEVDGGTFNKPTSGDKLSQYNAIGTILETKVVQYSEAACLLFNTDQGIIIAFRGTISGLNCSGFDDWLTNLQYYLTNWNHGVRVHTGFASDIDLALPWILRAIKDWGASKQLYVTGHSQGGGVGALAAYKLKEEAYDVDKVVLFAAPSSGDKAFADRYNDTLGLESRTVRYQHAGDIVPMLPPDMAVVPTTPGEQVQNVIQLVIEAISKANDQKGLRAGGNDTMTCISLGIRVLGVIMKIYQSIEKDGGQALKEDLTSYYSVGKVRFIEYNNKIEHQISYYSQVINIIPALFGDNGKSVMDCHSLDEGYEPALKP